VPRWPAPSPVEISAKVPVLLLQAKDDPATPLVGAYHMRSAPRGSRLVTAAGGNHGQFLYDENTCLDQPAADYLVTGTLPANDVSCPAVPPPAPAR
jgi:pimeloyl-ACP methyl ester carboxylesterase